MTRPRYYGEFPRAYATMRNRALTLGLGCLTPFLGFAIVGALAVYYSIIGMWLEERFILSFGLVAGIAGLAFCVWLLWTNVTDLFSDVFVARLVPCYARSVGLGDENTFARGCYLGKHCRTLDEVARRLGVKPLSEFGDLSRVTGDRRDVQWYEPDEAIPTLDALANALGEDPSAAAEAKDVLEDLRVLRAGLEKASQKGIAFRIVLRHGHDKLVVPLEIERVQGTFW